MSMNSPIVRRPSSGRRSLAPAVLAVVFTGAMVPAAPAQETSEKTIREHIKDYWDRLIARTESGARATGEEYHKLREEAARASGPAREKMAADLEVLGRKWAAARERLAASVELRMNALHEEMKGLEEKAEKSSGRAREKMAAEKQKLHEEWLAARAKLEATLSANLKSSRDQLEHIKEHAASATEEARAKLGPRMDRLKHEFHKDREKLAAYLEADLKQTKEDMEKLGAATSVAARRAKEALSKKYHDLQAKIEELTKEKEAEESK